MEDLVLILTNSADSSIEQVITHLRGRGQPFIRFNTECFPMSAALTISHSDEGRWSGTLSISGNGSSSRIDITSVKSVWTRGPVAPMLPTELHYGYGKFICEESGAALWSMYGMLAESYWMNHPLVASRLLEHNKLYQAKVAARLGMMTPRTVVTNDPEAALSFARACGGTAAVKMLKGNVFTKEGSAVPHFVFTQQITEEQIVKYWDDFHMSPVMVQEYVPKDIELRVTVVGETVFACAIHSQESEMTRHDWRRYDFANVLHEPYQLPSALQEKLIALLKFWGLNYGAIDLIRRPDGRYVFLELNPNGQWGWIEGITGMPISEAIAEALISAPKDSGVFPWR